MKENKIKSCPFCSGDAVTMQSYSRKQRGYFYYVKCVLCGSQSRAFFSREEDDSKGLLAVMAWNNRATGE